MQKFKINYKNNIRGITLISLVVTVVVLLILAGVSINLLLGENGLITMAQKAKEETEKSAEKEGVGLAITASRIGDSGYEELNQTNLQNAIDNQFGAGKATVSCDEDDIFTISFIDSKREYYIKDEILLDKDPKLLINQDNLEVGQYVEYHDIYSDDNEESDLTWRIIDTGNLNNNTGTVKIVSCGESVKYAYSYSDNYNAVDVVNDLTDYEKFKNIQFEGGIKGELFYDVDGKYAENARAFTVEDANFARGYTIENSNSYDNCFDNELINMKSYCQYWFATASSVWSLRYKHFNGDINPSTNATIPIRVVVTLKDNVKGRFNEDSNMWELE